MTEHIINKLAEFVIIMYDQSSTANRVNDTRVDLFARIGSNHIMSYASIPQEHIKRSVLQAGHILGQSLCSHYASDRPYYPLPTGVGKKIAVFWSHTGHPYHKLRLHVKYY